MPGKCNKCSEEIGLIYSNCKCPPTKIKGQKIAEVALQEVIEHVLSKKRKLSYDDMVNIELTYKFIAGKIKGE